MSDNPNEPSELDEDLRRAIWAGDLAGIDAAVAAGADPRTPGLCPIATAVNAGNPRTLRHLLRLGITLGDEAAFWSGIEKPFHNAAWDGRADLLEVLATIPDGKDFIDQCSDEHVGLAPLALAAQAGLADTVRWLLAAGAGVNAHHEAHAGETALAEAVMAGHAEVVRILLEAGANPDIPGWMWNSARDRAKKASEEIRALIAAVPFRPTDHPRYERSRGEPA